jgi:DNA-binding winged helix-turn-helix (wHTH) protein
MGERYRIGEWDFDADGAVLHGPGGERRLEDRAARTLALLCRSRGDILTHQQILHGVWNGRAVSPNSVAVVIADLRRALDDDARDPRHIVTIAKRGYRLNGPRPARGRPVWLAWAAAAMAVMLGLGTLAWVRTAEPRAAPERAVIVVLPVENGTGSARYAPLSGALGDLIVDRVRRQDDVLAYAADVGAVPGGSTTLRLKSRLILWNGQPTLSLSAIEDGSGRVAWSEMVAGPEAALAGHAIAALDRLGAYIQKLPRSNQNPYGVMTHRL